MEPICEVCGYRESLHRPEGHKFVSSDLFAGSDYPEDQQTNVRDTVRDRQSKIIRRMSGVYTPFEISKNLGISVHFVNTVLNPIPVELSNERQVSQIRELHQVPHTFSEIASILGVSPYFVYNVLENPNSETETSEPETTDLERELSSLLNRHSAENESNTPDFILAEYLMSCLTAFNTANNSRRAWRGEE